MIAKHQATERQRQIAEQRARLYMAERAAEEQRVARKAPSSTSTAKKAKSPKETRYIAVKTQNESFNKGQSAVMIYDTQSNQIVGNNVYDLKSTPKVGQTSKFDTYTAEYSAPVPKRVLKYPRMATLQSIFGRSQGTERRA